MSKHKRAQQAKLLFGLILLMLLLGFITGQGAFLALELALLVRLGWVALIKN